MLMCHVPSEMFSWIFNWLLGKYGSSFGGPFQCSERAWVRERAQIAWREKVYATRCREKFRVKLLCTKMSRIKRCKKSAMLKNVEGWEHGFWKKEGGISYDCRAETCFPLKSMWMQKVKQRVVRVARREVAERWGRRLAKGSEREKESVGRR